MVMRFDVMPWCAKLYFSNHWVNDICRSDSREDCFVRIEMVLLREMAARLPNYRLPVGASAVASVK
jgi:hypothetical protein